MIFSTKHAGQCWGQDYTYKQAEAFASGWGILLDKELAVKAERVTVGELWEVMSVVNKE